MSQSQEQNAGQYKTLLVCGSRDYKDRARVYATLDAICTIATALGSRVTRIVNGGQRGADKLSTEWARERGVDYKEYEVSPAEWKQVGAAAGPIRNGRMLHAEQPDLVVAFPGGRGTADMIRQAEECGFVVLKIKGVVQ